MTMPGDYGAEFAAESDSLAYRTIGVYVFLRPDGASRGLVLLGEALAREPDYAATHGYAAWCHEILFLRGGFREENRLVAIRHAHDALAHGRDDATALALAGFVIGLLEHDHATASDAFETAVPEPVICIFVPPWKRYRWLGRERGACCRMG
jgi:hypothetical protein